MNDVPEDKDRPCFWNRKGPRGRRGPLWRRRSV